jgi:hypothetical protein
MIYETGMLPVVLYRCETRYLALKKNRDWVCVFVCEQGAEQRVWIIGGWNDRWVKVLHNGELHNLYSSPKFIRMIISWKKTWKATSDTIKIYAIILVVKFEGKNLLARPRRRWWIIGIWKLVRFKVFMAVMILIILFWGEEPCGLAGRSRPFRKTCWH